MNFILPIIILIILVLLMYIFFIRPVINGISSLVPGGSKRVLQKTKGMTTTFKDVAGIDYVKEELEEIVDLLKNPEKYKEIGAKMPRGVLCVGPPGTGKTLMAKAVAGEANCAFFSVSGSEFVEVFVGVGASRIRKMFSEARKSAPCIIFIDEIDAIGGHRGTGLSGGHSEREQTLNQLLVEMDGFDACSGVVIIAATNRPDSLDKALLRPGRFDRNITIDLPGRFDREQILKVHITNVKTSGCANLEDIAKSTPGSSGADLANMINEAALLAVKQGRTTVTHLDLVESRDKVMFGKARKGKKITKQDRKITAYHEAGHAIVSLCLQDDRSDKVEKVTIIPRGRSLGATHFLPEDDKVHWSESSMKKELIILLAGRASEEAFIKDPTSGAMGDIQSATQIARNYVCNFGMDPELGMVQYNTSNDYSMLTQQPRTSESTLAKIDDKIKKLISDAKLKADELVKEQSQAVDTLAYTLLDKETIFREELENLFKDNKA